MKNKLVFILTIFFICLSQVSAKETVKLSKCIDGDTIKVFLNDKEYTVRMLAIDTPETKYSEKGEEYYGKEASDYTCKRVTNAKKIELEYDEASDKFDKYDRLLAWVFLDGRLLQIDLIKDGYAKVAYLYGDYKYTDTLKEKQELASTKKIGIWNDEKRNQFKKSDSNSEEQSPEDKYSNIEILIITIILLIVSFITNLGIKKTRK